MVNFNTKSNSKIYNVLQKLKYQLIGRHFYAITGPLRVLPDFIIVGAMKSGTTSLYYNICEHPCVKPASYDEIGYFDVNYHLGLNWYKSMFPTKFTQKKITLGHFPAPSEYSGEWRCDTHPRSSNDGHFVVIDSPHSGGRQLHLLDIRTVIQ